MTATKLFPMLSCDSVQRSMEFYGGLLGGRETYRFPEVGDVVFVTLSYGDGSDIGLGSVVEAPVHGFSQRPALGHRIELCVYVDDVDATYARARHAGFAALVGPADMPWGERTAWLADPDGNLVMLTR